jgi:predicted dehydrogenase
MTSNPTKFGLIGAGAIANAYAQAFQKTPEANIVVVADNDPIAAKSLADELGCPSFDSHLDLLRETECDAILVATPPSTHRSICIDALEQGVAVLCEKPLSIGSSAARQMLEVADKNGVLLTMASKFRYVDDVIRAKRIVDSGILGEIVLFENSFTAHVDMSKRWNSNPEVSGGGVLIDNGTHSVDLIRYFLGPIKEVHAIEGKRIQGLEVEDTAQIFVRSTGGVMGKVDLSWSLNKELESYIDIYGSEGNIRVGWKESKYRQTGNSDWVVFGDGYKKIEAFRNQIENFSRAILGKEPLVIQSTDAIASVEVVEAAYDSLQRDHWVPVQNGYSVPGGNSPRLKAVSASK